VYQILKFLGTTDNVKNLFFEKQCRLGHHSLIRKCWTYNEEVVGLTPGRVAINCLLLRWVTVCEQLNHLSI